MLKKGGSHLQKKSWQRPRPAGQGWGKHQRAPDGGQAPAGPRVQRRRCVADAAWQASLRQKVRCNNSRGRPTIALQVAAVLLDAAVVALQAPVFDQAGQRLSLAGRHAAGAQRRTAARHAKKNSGAQGQRGARPHRVAAVAAAEGRLPRVLPVPRAVPATKKQRSTAKRCRSVGPSVLSRHAGVRCADGSRARGSRQSQAGACCAGAPAAGALIGAQRQRHRLQLAAALGVS